MAASSSSWIITLFLLSLLSFSGADETAEPAADSKEFVLTLDHSNFDDTISKHDFIVVEFYAPWCGHCKKLAPEYEKAASILSSNEPPVVLAKVDANEEKNKAVANQYDVKGFPTIKIFRDGGKIIQEYKGPREAEGIVSYLKKQSGPASAEIKSKEDAATLTEGKVVIVGVFPEFSGEKFNNFSALAQKLRSDYEFAHTLDAKLLPRGESSVSGPLIRLFKPFDELVVDFEDFKPEELEKFVEEASTPTVTLFNKDPNNHPFVIKFFNSANSKAMLFLDFSSELVDAFKSKYHDVAKLYKGQGISFLIGDLEASKGAFQYFGLKDDQVPLVVIQTTDGQKYLKANVEPDLIESWIKEFKDGKLQPYKKSQPIPAANDEPVKVVVAETFDDIVFKSGKNVLIEFYAPWCGHCKKLAPILDEVAVSFESDPEVVITKLDATENDISQDTFEVKGYPTLYFKSASGKISQYTGGRTKEEIIDFIHQSRDKAVQADTRKSEL